MLFTMPILTFLIAGLHDLTFGRIYLANDTLMCVFFLILPVSAIYFLTSKNKLFKAYGIAISFFVVYLIYNFSIGTSGAF